MAWADYLFIGNGRLRDSYELYISLVSVLETGYTYSIGEEEPKKWDF